MKDHRPPFVKVAWGLIIVFVLGLAILQAIPDRAKESNSEDSDPIGLVLVQLQAEYLLGIAQVLGAEQEIATQAEFLDAGSIGQRQRYMAFMIAMGDPEAAKQSALRMRVELEKAQRSLTETQWKTQEYLDQRANGETIPDSVSLETQLGWFGILVEADQEKRREMGKVASIKVFTAGAIMAFILFAAVVGFIGLIIMLVRTLNHQVQSGLNPEKPRHGIYAEVFALWLFLFMALITSAQWIGQQFVEDNPSLEMSFSLLAFFGSLCALFWARFRGVSWRQIRLDIGWTRGAGLFKEIFWGVSGYAMMLPFLGIGIIITMILLFFQGTLAGGTGGDPFGGTSGGSHPIVLEIANGDLHLRILLIVLATIAAPVVEETMFRGVLYRQLRSSSKNVTFALSVSGSVLVTSFIFAAIHPQGWAVIPALMGIAIGMNLLREWRGTLLPPMIVHGVSNGLVTSMMLIFLS
ncbi:MAG: CPBP family intramembrane metalloprotease [Phycisphaerales bacterium]|nr:CPBP family intramembrane metalloprotease [Planctomycetota bacterium]MBL6998007.1 CPBP family intramembrane metalloprotease [Phycisphaerales bacterium]